MSENEEKKNTAAELPDEALDMVAGGSGDDFFYSYCPYCRRNHHLRRLGDQTMPFVRIAETYRCEAKGRTFYKVGERYFDERERPIR